MTGLKIRPSSPPVRLLGIAGIAISVSLVLLAAYPWGDFVGHTHWRGIRWVPFAASPFRPVDIVLNLLLCVPLGVSAALTFRRGAVIGGSLALLVSLFVEAMQLFSHTRFPSSTDLVCNVTGAVVAGLVEIYRRRSRGEP